MATTAHEKGSLLVDAATPTLADIDIAKQSFESLKKALASGNKSSIEAALRRIFASEAPEAVKRLFLAILEEFSRGHSVGVTSTEKELSTREAAEYLGVSRPHVVKLVDAGLIPSRKVGSHRRIMLEDVVAYRKKTDESHEILDALANESQRLGLYNE